MRRTLPSCVSAALVALLAVTVLWKGGKTLESTWLLTGTAWAACLALLCAPRPTVAAVARPYAPVLLGAFLAWSLAAWFFSITPNDGFDELLRDASVAALCMALVPVVSVPRVRADYGRALLHGMSAVTLLAVAIGLFVYVLQPTNRFVGSFFDFRFDTDYWPNAWAEYLLLSWPVVAAWAAPWRKRLWWARVLVCGLVIGSLLLSYSRGAAIAFCGQLLVLGALLLWVHRAAVGRRQIGNAVVACVGVAIVSVGVFFAVNAVRARFHPVESVAAKVTFTAGEGTSSIDERSQFWRQSVALLRERPLFGWGPHSFRFLQPRLQEGILATSDHPHNMWLKLAMERGIPSALLLAAALLALMAPAVASLFSARSSPPWIPFALAAVLGVLAHNLIDFNLQFVGIVLPLWLLLAALGAQDGVAQRRGVRSRVVLAFAAAIATAAFAAAVREVPLQRAASQGRFFEASGRFAEALSSYAQAQASWFPRDLGLSRVTVLVALHRLADAEEALLSYRKENGVDPRSFTVSGFLHLSQKRPREALGEFSQAFLRNGYNDASILRGILLSLDGLHQPALNRTWEARLFSRFEAYVDAVAANTHFIALSRNVEELEQSLALAETVYPYRREELRASAARLRKEADDERARLSARSPGLLW